MKICILAFIHLTPPEITWKSGNQQCIFFWVVKLLLCKECGNVGLVWLLLMMLISKMKVILAENRAWVLLHPVTSTATGQSPRTHLYQGKGGGESMNIFHSPFVSSIVHPFCQFFLMYMYPFILHIYVSVLHIWVLTPFCTKNLFYLLIILHLIVQLLTPRNTIFFFFSALPFLESLAKIIPSNLSGIVEIEQ